MNDGIDFGGEIAWRPSPEYIQEANLTRFMRQHKIENYETLMRRSTEDVPWFTAAVLDFLDIQFYRPYDQVVDLSGGIERPQWCLGGEMNIVHNCLDKYQGTEVAGRKALIWEGEEGQVRALTYAQLFRQVNKTANALRSLGIGKGDAVGIFMPMLPETVIALLAIAKIGGIIVPLFSGYGVSAVVTRLVDTGAKALFTVDGFYRRGKTVEIKPIADEAARQAPSLEHIIVFDRAQLPVKMQPGRDHWWSQFVDAQPEQAATERTSAEDILMVIYTSGTTGAPKGAVHTHCGFPVKSAQDMAFGTDVHPGEIVYWVTDMGWMMGPWLVFGTLLLGATMFINDGALDYPGPERLWSMVARHRINVLGLSPTLVRVLIPSGEEPVTNQDISSLRILGSTGEPWNPQPWNWLFETVGKSKLPIINYSGGTEISGGILMCNPLLPQKPTAFSAPCPGIAAGVFDENGNPVRGQVGELVITSPWIGMTRGFWKDPQRYLDTYWSRWPGVWVHGDWAAVDADGQWYLLGRSDDTIKIAGKRLGPAEVESVLVAHPHIVEAVAIGVPDAIKGNQLVVFCVPGPDCQPDQRLEQELKDMVAAEMGKALTPRRVIFLSDLPKTRNGKVMRRMIRSAYLGLDPGDATALVNPGILEEVQQARA